MMKLKTGDLLQSLPVATIKTNAVLDGPPSVEGIVVPNLGVNRRHNHHSAPVYGTSAVDVNLARYCPPLVLQRLILKRKPTSYLSALELQHFRNFGILPKELEVTGQSCSEDHYMLPKPDTRSTNSPYSGQDVNSTTSSNGQPSTNKDVNRHASSDDFRSLERKLEKERERRTHVDISPPRLESKDKDKSPEKSPELHHSSLAILGEDIPTMDLSKSNSFHANKKEILFNRSQQQQQSIHKSPSYRNTAVRDNLSNIAPSSSSATLRSYSIGFGSRDPQSLRSPTHRGRMRGTMVIPHGHGNDRLRRSKYQYPDPVAGCIPAFQQRLSELSTLKSDTIRYERAKRSKKKAKQDKN